MLRHFARLSIAAHRRYASTLVLAEHNNKQLNASTLAAVAAANKIGGSVSVLVAGSDCGAVAEEAAKISGVQDVLVADKPQYGKDLAENHAALILKLQESKKFSHILGTISFLSKSTLPRVAALLDVNQISEITAVHGENKFTRLMYAGNAVCEIESSDSVKVITVRPSTFDKASATGGSAAIEKVDISEDAKLSEWIKSDVVKSDRPELTSAKVIVVGGRALKDKETFTKLMFPLADKMGAAVGATRAAVDSQYCGNDLQIGQTGKVVAPGLYVGFGVSGAIQHLAGMKDAKTICVVNKDPDAPIVQVADYALIEDLFKVIPEMMAILK